MLAHQLIRGTSLLASKLRSNLTLRGAVESDGDVHLVGTPLIHSSGRVVLGPKTTLISSPAPVRLNVGPQGALFIEEGAVIGNGTTIVAHGTVRIGAGAEIGPSCIISDAEHFDSASTGGIEVGAGARLSARVTLLAGAVVPRGVRIARDTVIRASGVRPLEAPSALQDGNGAELLRRLRGVVGSVVPSVAAVAAEDDIKLATGWDSLSAIHVLVALESEFGVVLPSSLFERARTLEAIGAAVNTALLEVESPPSGVRHRAGD